MSGFPGVSREALTHGASSLDFRGLHFCNSRARAAVDRRIRRLVQSATMSLPARPLSGRTICRHPRRFAGIALLMAASVACRAERPTHLAGGGAEAGAGEAPAAQAPPPGA